MLRKWLFKHQSNFQLMNKSILLLIGIVAVLAVSGCTQINDNTRPQNTYNEKCINASIDIMRADWMNDEQTFVIMLGNTGSVRLNGFSVKTYLYTNDGLSIIDNWTVEQTIPAKTFDVYRLNMPAFNAEYIVVSSIECPNANDTIRSFNVGISS